MAWETSDRRSRLPADWNRIVAVVKKRDGWCRWKLPSGARCPRPGSDVDHIRNDDNHDLKNLRLLCAHHHNIATQKQARRGKWAKRQGRQRKPEAHPGQL